MTVLSPDIASLLNTARDDSPQSLNYTEENVLRIIKLIGGEKSLSEMLFPLRRVNVLGGLIQALAMDEATKCNGRLFESAVAMVRGLNKRPYLCSHRSVLSRLAHSLTNGFSDEAMGLSNHATKHSEELRPYLNIWSRKLDPIKLSDFILEVASGASLLVFLRREYGKNLVRAAFVGEVIRPGTELREQVVIPVDYYTGRPATIFVSRYLDHSSMLEKREVCPIRIPKV